MTKFMENQIDWKSKMKKLLLIGFILLVLCVGAVSAKCIGPVVNGESLGSEVYGEDDSQDSFQNNSGATYQYDLNKPQIKINTYMIVMHKKEIK